MMLLSTCDYSIRGKLSWMLSKPRLLVKLLLLFHIVFPAMLPSIFRSVAVIFTHILQHIRLSKLWNIPVAVWCSQYFHSISGSTKFGYTYRCDGYWHLTYSNCSCTETYQSSGRLSRPLSSCCRLEVSHQRRLSQQVVQSGSRTEEGSYSCYSCLSILDCYSCYFSSDSLKKFFLGIQSQFLRSQLKQLTGSCG